MNVECVRDVEDPGSVTIQALLHIASVIFSPNLANGQVSLMS